MKWFNSLFSKPETEKQSDESRQMTDNNNSESPVNVAVAAPFKVSKQQLDARLLKRFIPLRFLDATVIGAIPQEVRYYKQDDVIFQLGQPTSFVYYVLKGSVSVQPDSQNGYEVEAKSDQGNLPLNSSQTCGSKAIALTDVIVLVISVELNRLWAKKSQTDIDCVELIDIELPEAINDNQFFTSFCDAYHENKLQLPSLPNVAFKLKEAMKDEIGVNEAAEIIHLDAAIVTKLIQVANSPLYAPTKPITNCQDAINRLGLHSTRNLVMSISLKQLFQCKDKKLMGAMKQLWINSLYTSSLSFVLAQQCGGHINPEDALLAGLVTDIGVIPLLHFADQYPEKYPDIAELDLSIPYLRAPVGSLLLHTLGFSKEFSDIPHHAENWFYDSGESITLTDIVILSKLHGYFGSEKAQDLPHMNTIPAYSKLKEGQLDPDFSLSILQQAKQRINAAMSVMR